MTVDLKTPMKLNNSLPLTRREKFYLRYQMLNDNYKDQVLNKLKDIFTQTVDVRLDKQLDLTNNIFKTVTDEISRVYSFGVMRDTEDKTFQELIDSGAIDKVMKQSNRYVNALNDVLLQLSWNEKKSIPKFIFRLPHKTEVVTDADDNIIEVEYFVSKNEDNVEKWAFWSDSEHYYKLYDDNTHKDFTKEMIVGNENGENPYKELPFISMKNGFRDGAFWDIFKGDDLSEITLDNSIYSTFKNYMIKWQSFKQIVITGKDVGSVGGQLLDPSTALTVEGDEVQFNILDLQANLKELSETINDNADNVAINYKISPNQFRLSGQVSSGFALKMENTKLDEFTKEQQKDFQSYEKELFDLLVVIYGINNIKVTNDVGINIQSPNYSESRTDELTNYEKEVNLGIKSPVEIIEKERSVDEVEAEAIYTSNIKFRNQSNEKLNQGTLNLETTANELDKANA